MRASADPQATVPFEAVPEGDEPAPERRPKSPPPSKPGPAVRLIPREKPVPEPEVPAAQAPQARGDAATPEVPAAAEPTPETAAVPAERQLATQRAENARLSAEVERLRGQAAQAPRMRPEPGTGAARLRGDEAIVPLEHRGALQVWGPRLVAVVLVALLLIALALIVRGIL